ncbi:MAG: transposase [Bacteroidetes bacterium]|nr:transposase [Bacteroidota bacterium]
MDDTVNNLSLTGVFTQIPVVHFKTIKAHCPDCQSALKVHHTDTRRVYSLHIGVFNAHRTFMYCPDCNKVYPAEDFENIVPKYSNVGYDIIEFIGRLIFLEYHTLRETIQALENRNIHISSSEVAYLAQKFIIYLSILHKEARIKLKELIQKKGGYILHVDGTSEEASPHLISAIDEISNFVLANIKVPSESKEQIVPFLKEIKEQYGGPLAVTSDMGRALLSAISEVFLNTPHYICHFHFLRDLGKDLLEKEYSIMRNKLKKYGVTSQLRYRLRYYFENKTKDINVSQINETIKTTKKLNSQDNQLLKQICHILILWTLDGKNYGNGFGFPFDRPHSEFYKRLDLLYRKLKSFQNKCDNNKLISKMITKLVDDLSPLINDIECLEAYQIFSEKEKVFDKLRQALSIALPTTANGLNDNGEDVEIETIENRVKEFKKWFFQEGYKQKNNDYQKLIGQIEKYWEKLFSDPIQITSSEGDSFIQPQRTNNILEQFFREIRRAHRRTTGNNSMCKKLQSMFADTPLVKNLNNPDYMKVILNGKMSLEEKFAEIDYKQVIARTKDAGNCENKMPRKIKNMIRENQTMDKILYLIAV